MITIIAAVSENGVIGRAGKIPWSLPEDQRRFRELTWGHTLIMGRRTFEEIGRPLPGRRTILLSRTRKIETELCRTAESLEEALDMAAGEPEIFIAGGSRVYEEGLRYADRIHLTVVQRHVEGDAFFPDFSGYEFEKIWVETQEEYRVEMYEKKVVFDIDKRGAGTIR